MSGWYVVSALALVAAQWIALLIAYGRGFRAARDEARTWCAESLGIRHEIHQRTLADEKRRCDARVRGARLRFEPSVFASEFISREKSGRLN